MTPTARILTLCSWFVLATGARPARAEPPRAAPFFLEGTLYVAPDVPKVPDGVVVVEDGRITAAGARGSVEIPRGARRSPCSGGVITAGFHNSHVRFLGPDWEGAARRPAAQLNRALRQMLTRYGYTTVVDTGSDRDNTFALAQRVARGELTGPRVLTVGAIPRWARNTSRACAARSVRVVRRIVARRPRRREPRWDRSCIRRLRAQGREGRRPGRCAAAGCCPTSR